MNKTIEQLEKDIEEKRISLLYSHSLTIDNIKRLRDSLQMQTANLEYLATEMKLLEAELAQLKGGKG